MGSRNTRASHSFRVALALHDIDDPGFLYNSYLILQGHHYTPSRVVSSDRDQLACVSK